MSRNIYLSNYELEEALNIYFDRLGEVVGNTEIIKTWEACNRVSANAVYSKISSPFYNSSAMDGIAVDSLDTVGASDRNHLTLVEEEDYLVVDTGDPIPSKYDSVIMVEDLIKADDNKVNIYKSAAPWQNIRSLGEDIVENQLIIPSKHKIRPVDIGAMIAGGINEVCVFKKPTVGIIPTGTEIVEPDTELKIGDIIEFNSRTFSAQAANWGGIPKRYPIVDDIYEDIKEACLKAVKENDIVIINAGSSAGREDFTSKVIGELGEVIVHGVAIKPGKPVILGKVQGKPVIGIPGFPVSAYFIMELIVKKVIEKYEGIKSKPLKEIDAILSRRIMSSLKYLEFVRIKLGYVGDKLIATPLTRGAGATMSLVRADAILEVPQSVEGLETGQKIKVKLLKDIEEIKSTLVCIGSHDPIVDILSDMIHLKDSKYYLSSAHVGSMGGIMALKRNEAHLSPIHLLDMETGEYNITYINKYLKDKNISLIKGVKRIQGIMVKKGNPLNIASFSDIAKSGARFVNRQRGAGTRFLLDYNLKQSGIDVKDIKGYEREEFTHLAVAAAVSSADADCGLGVYSAAVMMGLDFIPVCNEEYDFAIPEEFLELDNIKLFIEILRSDEFKNKLEILGGYDTKDSGEIQKIN